MFEHVIEKEKERKKERKKERERERERERKRERSEGEGVCKYLYVYLSNIVYTATNAGRICFSLRLLAILKMVTQMLQCPQIQSNLPMCGRDLMARFSIIQESD